jgi:phosphonatase-like hydrolase
MENIGLVIFDVAGTTAKDEGLVVKAFISAAQSQGVEEGSLAMAKMVEYVKETMGQRKIDVFTQLFENDTKLAAAAHDVFVETYLRLVADGELEEFEGVSELFTKLRERHIGIALTTGFPREILDLIIESLGWTEHIDFSVAASEVSFGRPYPDMIFRAIESFNIQFGMDFHPDDIAVVGDTISDMQSGVSAGARFVVGINSGTHSSDQLRTTGATHVLDSVTDLLTQVN